MDAPVIPLRYRERGLSAVANCPVAPEAPMGFSLGFGSQNQTLRGSMRGCVPRLSWVASNRGLSINSLTWIYGR